MLNLIPKPTSIQIGMGQFLLSPDTKLRAKLEDQEIAAIASLVSDYLEQVSGYKNNLAEGNADHSSGNIQLTLNGDASLGEEGYELSITTDAITLGANCPAGLFYGVQTLRQLLPTQPSETISLPALSIRDIPRFSWRGAMLDVARHFFGVEHAKRYIDLIAAYKINRLHLHLSDDQGWRIEIKSGPG